MREGIDHLGSTVRDSFQRLLCVHQCLALHLLQVAVGEVAALDALHLSQTGLDGFLLAAEGQLGYGSEYLQSGIIEGHACRHSHHDDVLVHQRVQVASLAVGEQGVSNVEGRSVGIVVCRTAAYLRLNLNDGYRHLDAYELSLAGRGHGLYVALGYRSRLHASEGLFEQRLQLVGIDVATENESHIRGHVVFLVERFHVAQSRILQIFRRTDDGLSVGMVLEDGAQGFFQSLTHAVGRTVLLFVHILQLTLEPSEHGVDESFGVQPAPLLHELRQKRVVVVGHVVARAGIQTAATIA